MPRAASIKVPASGSSRKRSTTASASIWWGRRGSAICDPASRESALREIRADAPSPLAGEGCNAGRHKLAWVRGMSPRTSVHADRYPSSGAARHLLPQGEKEERTVGWAKAPSPCPPTQHCDRSGGHASLCPAYDTAHWCALSPCGRGLRWWETQARLGEGYVSANSSACG